MRKRKAAKKLNTDVASLPLPLRPADVEWRVSGDGQGIDWKPAGADCVHCGKFVLPAGEGTWREGQLVVCPQCGGAFWLSSNPDAWMRGRGQQFMLDHQPHGDASGQGTAALSLEFVRERVEVVARTAQRAAEDGSPLALFSACEVIIALMAGTAHMAAVLARAATEVPD